ncbi:amidohydrolase [Anaerococcus sp. mt242]|uniref:M20 metallopeptidase family protein n=1 Tax=Anaerococcus sp. mt242 TaxID=2661917 RepID=UPI0019325A91|nr:M20 family metallopeptidase [Anaerococcus sp. mt242]MBM0046164.1 amidohydrolase [Anaerococcus sp. mt242]
MDYIELAKANEDLCIEMRRELHKIPELELELPKTVAYVKSKLDDFGIEYKEYVNGNGLSALIEGSEAGKCLAIRADMDALPVAEETGLEFASTHPGKMHACGHDSHTAIALTAAKILNENKDKLKGSVKFIFQPGEEIPGGAKPMIDEGVLENPKVDFIIGMHGGHLAEIPRGSIAFKENEMMAAMDKFTIEVNGKGGHGASPHLAIDPIVISGEILMGLQKIISREIAPVDSALVSVCKINGGFTQNIIPDKVEMMGTARSLSEDVRDIVEKRVIEISEGIAKTYGGSADVNYERFYPVLNNDPEFTGQVKSIVSDILPEDVFDLRKPVMGGEDMAFYQQEVPGCFMFLSNLGEHSDGVCYPNHNSKFNLDESLFYKGVATFIASAFEILK